MPLVSIASQSHFATLQKLPLMGKRPLTTVLVTATLIFLVVLLYLGLKYETRRISYEASYAFELEVGSLAYEDYSFPTWNRSSFESTKSGRIGDQILDLIDRVLKDTSSQSYTSVQVLPRYEPRAYKTPLKADWFSYANYGTGDNDPRQRMINWERLMSNRDHEQAMEILRILHEEMSAHGIGYVLTYGTLLGAGRHFDIIPWDDDVDLTVAFKYKNELIKIIDQSELLQQTNVSNYMLKVTLRSSPERPGRQSKYPYVDIFFHNTTRMHVVLSRWGPPFRIPKSEFYPLKLMPLGKYWLPAPAKPFHVLKRTHIRDGRRICKTNGEDHVREVIIPSYTRNCSELVAFHPFTQRVCLGHENEGGLCFEKLTISRTNTTVYLFEHKSNQVALTVVEN